MFAGESTIEASSWLPPRKSLAMSPAAGAVAPLPFRITRIVGFERRVMSSVFDTPVSDAGRRSKVGAAGAVVSPEFPVWKLKSVVFEMPAHALPARSVIAPLVTWT